MIIDEGAPPLLVKLVIGDCPQLKEVPSGIHHLKSLKILKFDEMPTEFVLSLQPDEGPVLNSGIGLMGNNITGMTLDTQNCWRV